MANPYKHFFAHCVCFNYDPKFSKKMQTPKLLVPFLTIEDAFLYNCEFLR